MREAARQLRTLDVRTAFVHARGSTALSRNWHGQHAEGLSSMASKNLTSSAGPAGLRQVYSNHDRLVPGG